jgi:predicted dehydrogenase
MSAAYTILAPHDISMMLYLLGEQPVSVGCSGLAHLNEGVHDVCNLNLTFRNNRIGMIHVSWLDPRKRACVDGGR